MLSTLLYPLNRILSRLICSSQLLLFMASSVPSEAAYARHLPRNRKPFRPNHIEETLRARGLVPLSVDICVPSSIGWAFAVSPRLYLVLAMFFVVFSERSRVFVVSRSSKIGRQTKGSRGAAPTTLGLLQTRALQRSGPY